MEEALQSDRIILLSNGSILMDGNPESVFSDIDKIKSAGLEVPQVVELLYSLRKRGINITVKDFKIQTCVDALLKLLRG